MILLLLQKTFGDQDGHGDVLVTVSLEHRVKLLLDIFPDRVAIGAQNEKALYAGIVHQLRLRADIGEPLGKVNLHIGDLLYFLLFCHKIKFSNLARALAPPYFAALR